MTVSELMSLLAKQEPTDVVMIEDVYGNHPIDDDWARCHFLDSAGEVAHGFCLTAYERPDNRERYRANDPTIV